MLISSTAPSPLTNKEYQKLQNHPCRHISRKVGLSPYPEGAPLTQLKHPKHTILKLHCAIELGQVVVIDAHQLKHGDM